MMIRYLQRETTSEALPRPSPSRAPQDVTDTEETRKPAQMIRRAVLPAAICLRIGGEHSDKLSRHSQTDDRSDKHDHTTHTQRNKINFFHTFMLSGTVIISDDRAHALDDSACRKDTGKSGACSRSRESLHNSANMQPEVRSVQRPAQKEVPDLKRLECRQNTTVMQGIYPDGGYRRLICTWIGRIL